MSEASSWTSHPSCTAAAPAKKLAGYHRSLQADAVIATVAFRNFKALRATSVTLGAFNLVIGPNGSGKTSLMEAVLRLRSAAHLLPEPPSVTSPSAAGGATPPDRSGHPRPAAGRGVPATPEIDFHFSPPYQGLTAHLEYENEARLRSLRLEPADAKGWPELRARWGQIRGHVLDHTAMAAPSLRKSGQDLAYDGGNVAAVLARIRDEAPAAFSALTAEMLRIVPEFRSLELAERSDARVELGLRLADNGLVTPTEMSQGMLYLLAMLALSFDPNSPPVLCLEDVDRGIHPRMLREVRDALYRLSYPQSFGLSRAPTQLVVTTHSPYFIDLFREHPEEVVISEKHGRAARFQRLADRPDLPDLLREGNLGDMWFSGILGGVPDEP